VKKDIIEKKKRLAISGGESWYDVDNLWITIPLKWITTLLKRANCNRESILKLNHHQYRTIPKTPNLPAARIQPPPNRKDQSA